MDVIATHKNAHTDLLGSGIERVWILERAVKEIGADRVLYRSDFTINEPSAVIARIRNASLIPKEREKTLFGTVERLLVRAGKSRPQKS